VKEGGARGNRESRTVLTKILWMQQRCGEFMINNNKGFTQREFDKGKVKEKYLLEHKMHAHDSWMHPDFRTMPIAFVHRAGCKSSLVARISMSFRVRLGCDVDHALNPIFERYCDFESSKSQVPNGFHCTNHNLPDVNFANKSERGEDHSKTKELERCCKERVIQ
jgi:hypothetical protein